MNSTWKVKLTNDASSSPDSVPVVSEPVETIAVTSAAADHSTTTGASSKVKAKIKNNNNSNSDIPGFIFLCNGKTRPECFYYRVFGLPMSQWKLVERIKPGTKLFLFDYDMRVLYGIYEAASEGTVNIEPAAFEGRFLAQVKFVIVEECPPLAEVYFKKAIMEDYRSTKVVSELNESQVNTLVALFRSLSSSSTNPMAPENAGAELTVPSPPRVLAPRPIRPVQAMQHHNHMAAGSVLVDHVHHSFQHQSFPSPIGPCNAHFQGPYSTRDYMQVPQEPYPRYNSEMVPQYHPMGFGNEYRPFPIWGEPVQQGNHAPIQEYNIWYHPGVPLFSETNSTLTFNTSSSVQPNVPAFENPAPAYPVPTGSYFSSTLPPHEPVTGIPVPAYSLPAPDLYFSSPMQPIYAPVPVRPAEPNYIFPTASYVSSPMDPYGPESGIPPENHPLNSAFYSSSTMQP